MNNLVHKTALSFPGPGRPKIRKYKFWFMYNDRPEVHDNPGEWKGTEEEWLRYVEERVAGGTLEELSLYWMEV